MGACLTAAATSLIDRAIATSPVVIAVAGAIAVTPPIPTAVMQAVRQLDGCQVVANLIETHGIIDGYPPQVLQKN